MEEIRVFRPGCKILGGSGGYFRTEGEKGVGIISRLGKSVVEPEHDDVLICTGSDGVEMFVCKDKCEDGREIFSLVHPDFGLMSDLNFGECIGFRERMAVVKTENGIECREHLGGRLVTVFELRGDMLKSPSFRSLYHDEMLRVCNRLGYYHCYYDKKGCKKTPYFQNAGDFVRGLAVASRERLFKGNGYGIIDKSGRWVVPPKYDSISTFRNFHAMVYNGGKFGFFGNNCKLTVPIQWDKAADFGPDGRAFVRMEEPLRACLIDGFGEEKLRLPDNCVWARSFSDDMLPAKAGEKWGYIDRGGKWAIEPRYDYAGDFWSGAAPVCIDGKWSFINKNAQILMEVEGRLQEVGRGLAHTEYEIFEYR